MIQLAALMLFLAAPSEDASLPRHADADAIRQQAATQSARDGEPTDPLFDKRFVATDDAAFLLTAIESSRQGVVDARDAENIIGNPQLRDAAVKIRAQNQSTAARLEAVARKKGWRLPEPNSQRATTLQAQIDTSLADTNFVLHQISFHEATVAQFRAQIAGKGDAELKRVLRAALPGYQQNLDLLLRLKL